MKALITGAGGQLGRALIASTPAGVDAIAVDRASLDISDGAAVAALVTTQRPQLILNAAAYTAVDRAESEVAQAMAINGEAVGHLADAARAVGARLVHVSTDFVFDGMASTPYPVNAPYAPLSVYGRSKMEGEIAARRAPDALIMRTAWVYAARGHNFVHTMLRLMRERDELKVVYDQIGTPSHAGGIARALWNLASAGVAGTLHYTDSGVASWYDFAVAIQEEALAIGLLDRAVPVHPIPSSAFPTPARRPSFSVLDKEATWAALGWRAPHWRVNLRSMLKDLRDHG